MSVQINLFEDGALLSYAGTLGGFRICPVGETTENIFITVVARRTEADTDGVRIMVGDRATADALADYLNDHADLPEPLVQYESVNSVIRPVRWRSAQPVDIAGAHHLYFATLDDAAEYMEYCVKNVRLTSVR